MSDYRPYIPRSDTAFGDWLRNFANIIAADPGRYDLDAADAEVLVTLSARYDAAYMLVQHPSTRTSPAIAAKDAVRAQAAASARVYAMRIKHTAAVDNNDRIALGLHVNDPTSTPTAAPATLPLLAITGAGYLTHYLRYADGLSPNLRRKPPGATHLQLNATIGPVADANPETARLVGLYTRQPIAVVHAPAQAGLIATYFARWVTRTGKTGAWSAPRSMTIAAADAAARGERGRVAA